MNENTMKWVRAGVAVGVLLILLVVVSGWMGDYKRAAASAKAKAAFQTEVAKTAAAKKKTADDADAKPEEKSPADKTATTGHILVVKIDGLNFRRDPTPDGKAIRGLKKGEKITLLKAEGSWFFVRDAKGVQGYISSNSQYTSAEK